MFGVSCHFCRATFFRATVQTLNWVDWYCRVTSLSTFFMARFWDRLSRSEPSPSVGLGGLCFLLKSGAETGRHIWSMADPQRCPASSVGGIFSVCIFSIFALFLSVPCIGTGLACALALLSRSDVIHRNQDRGIVQRWPELKLEVVVVLVVAIPATVSSLCVLSRSWRLSFPHACVVWTFSCWGWEAWLSNTEGCRDRSGPKEFWQMRSQLTAERSGSASSVPKPMCGRGGRYRRCGNYTPTSLQRMHKQGRIKNGTLVHLSRTVRGMEASRRDQEVAGTSCGAQ